MKLRNLIDKLEDQAQGIMPPLGAGDTCGGVRVTAQSAKQRFTATGIDSTFKAKVRAQCLERHNGPDRAFESMLKAGSRF